MKIKKGDTVKVMKGKDAGKTGKVAQVLPKEGKVVVEGLNILVKQLKPRTAKEKGQRLEFSAPLSAANAQVVCPKCNMITRIGYTVLPQGEHQRTCRKCHEIL